MLLHISLSVYDHITWPNQNEQITCESNCLMPKQTFDDKLSKSSLHQVSVAELRRFRHLSLLIMNVIVLYVWQCIVMIHRKVVFFASSYHYIMRACSYTTLSHFSISQPSGINYVWLLTQTFGKTNIYVKLRVRVIKVIRRWWYARVWARTLSRHMAPTYVVLLIWTLPGEPLPAWDTYNSLSPKQNPYSMSKRLLTRWALHNAFCTCPYVAPTYMNPPHMNPTWDLTH